MKESIGSNEIGLNPNEMILFSAVNAAEDRTVELYIVLFGVLVENSNPVVLP